MDYGVLRGNDSTVRLLEEAVQTAGSTPDVVLSLTDYTLGIALLIRDDAADRDRGLALMVQFREFVGERAPFLVPVADLWIARARARCGDRNAAIRVMREAVAEMHQARRLGYGVWGTGVLVETLLERGDEGDLAEAQQEFDRLADLAADQDSAILHITLLRLRTLLARTRGDDSYRDLVGRYRDMARSLGYEGHIDWAEAMIEDGGQPSAAL
jgi:hypothetical protein